MKTLITTFFLLCCATKLYAGFCQVYEYAEIKDMSKQHLLREYSLAMEGFYKLSDPKYFQIYGITGTIDEQGNCLERAKQYERVLLKFHKTKKTQLDEIREAASKKYERQEVKQAPPPAEVYKTKICPSCKAEINADATVCKKCWHEFDGPPAGPEKTQ